MTTTQRVAQLETRIATLEATVDNLIADLSRARGIPYAVLCQAIGAETHEPSHFTA